MFEKPTELAKDLYRVMRAGDEASFSFTGEQLGFCASDDNEYKLCFTGEVDVPPEYRCEPKYPVLYRRICESLVPCGNEYKLKVVSDDKRLPKGVFCKAYDFPAGLKYLDFACNASGQCNEDADCRIELDVYYRKDTPRFAFESDAEIKERIDLCGAGSYTKRMELNGDVDFVLVSLRFENFTGEYLLDSPTLTDERGVNYVPAFTVEPRDLTAKKWIGLNLSKIERPWFEIELNGNVIFSGESFERIYRFPSHEFVLPKNLIRAGQNTVGIKYVGGYIDPLDYTLRDVSILVSPTEQGIIAHEKYAREEFGVLVKLKRDEKVICSASRREIVPLNKTVKLSAGLHVLRFRAVSFVGGACISVKIGDRTYTAELERYVEKDCRDVITGTSDSIYNRLDYKGMTDYLEWYLHNRLGNMFTFRTSYRWSGSDRIEDGIHDWTINTLSDYGVCSAIMLDGRELPSAVVNRKYYTGNSDKFLGYQSHERDGAFYYWGTGKHTRDEAFYYELFSRLYDCEGIEPLHAVVKRRDDYYKYYDNTLAKNMKEGCENFIRNISAVAKDSTRHSGPSVFFKYFFKAGLKWLCAELMYGCEEACVAALRGASLAAGQSGYGGHMAVQWSTQPHDEIYRYRRYFNSLMLAYT
ncbi:MAG: hypothetical protein K2L51_01570, partial [Clostridiales bacterium]|nr:hypothetical protein [Clostridiales bacterium]